jgi:hypothetical protein
MPNADNMHTQPNAEAGEQEFSTTKAEQPSKRSQQGVEHLQARARIGGEKNHRRRVDAGEARKNAR